MVIVCILKDTPLHTAAKHGHLQVFQFFVEELECPPNTRGQHNLTPSQLAKNQGPSPCGSLLTEISAFN